MGMFDTTTVETGLSDGACILVREQQKRFRQVSYQPTSVVFPAGQRSTIHRDFHAFWCET
jgi:hypothetical protein